MGGTEITGITANATTTRITETIEIKIGTETGITKATEIASLETIEITEIIETIGTTGTTVPRNSSKTSETTGDH